MTYNFDGFEYKAPELSAYIYSVGIFIISLKNGQVIRHEPENPDDFLVWLKHHRIRDVRDELPPHIFDAFFQMKRR